MATQKLEYDTVGLANHVPTYRYAASALQEIRQLMNEMKNPKSSKLIFQTLPKHLRRRAMSHYPKRLPRKYRMAHCEQMAKAGTPRISKMPSRKHRRRPKNLLSEYLRRQRRKVWLETHIWHARRFHMINRWGYRLPYAICDKTYRACYRATVQHCLLQDISFYNCLQLQGSLKILRIGFTRLSSIKCGLGITAKTFLHGNREGSIELFKDEQYPNGALGRVSFIWRPINVETDLIKNDDKRTLWLWIHPSSYQSIFEEIIKVFEFVSVKNSEMKSKLKEDADEDIPSQYTKKEQRKFAAKNLAYSKLKHYVNEEHLLELIELKNNLNRFRLTGILSQRIITNALKPKLCNGTEGDTSENWFKTLLSEKKGFKKIHEEQAVFWGKCANVQAPTGVMSNVVIAVNVEDPRINRPQKRTKATLLRNIGTLEEHEFAYNMPKCLADSVLWDEEIRRKVSDEMLSSRDICELRSKHVIVPGLGSKFEESLQPVPVLLIQHPGSQEPNYKRLGYGCGWDIIAPAGYGMAIWVSLIMQGAKSGGLREFDSVARELGNEEHLPDTVGGLQQAFERHQELSVKYFYRPPNKRCNYNKCSIVSPFRAPFKELIRDWLPTPSVQNSDNKNTFHILRDRALLLELRTSLQKNHNTFPSKISNNSLIQLQFRMKFRGNLNQFSVICLPTFDDIKRYFKQMKYENRDPVYTEPLQPDPKEKVRKQVRQQHKKLLKRLRAQRVRDKRKKQQTSTIRVHLANANTSHLVSAQWKKMCSLWLSEDCTALQSVRRQCTREVFGYVTSAGFCFTEAAVCAIGYVTSEGLKQLLKICKLKNISPPMCLVRDTKSRHYRFVTFKINVEF